MLTITNTDGIGSRICDAREAKGMSRQNLADHIGVRVSTVEKWERGTMTPRANRLATIAGVLDLSVLWLIEGSDDMEPAARRTRVEVVAQKLERVLQMQEEMSRIVAEISIEVAEIQRIEEELEELAA